jgi:5-methylcytosine-specific restriction endonuclease McrA
MEARMNLKQMNDEGLLNKTDVLVREERELLTTILHHFREIERRRLFSALGYKSLFDMAVRRFGYSEDQAYRRIAAMRMLKELPEVEEKITKGEITLTHIGLAHSLFRQEKKHTQKEMPRESKLSVIEKIAGTPVRDAERITLSLSSAPEAARPDRVVALSENCIELKFTASSELQRKIERLKGLLAHQNPNLSIGELFERLCDLGLEQWNPGKPTKTGAKAAESAEHQKTAAPRKRCVRPEPKAPSAAVTRAVWRRAGSCCEICGSSFALEIDHRVPRAKGGSSDIENCRLLCRSCNQRAAIEEFGQITMDHYIN